MDKLRRKECVMASQIVQSAWLGLCGALVSADGVEMFSD
jgi:hypothetical protein